MIALVIPVDGPVYEIEVGAPNAGDLETLQAAVGGYIEALPVPEFVPGADRATCYVNEEGKFDPDCRPNMRATDFMVPGIGLMPGDWIAGPLVVAGFDPRRGEHAELPPAVVARIRLIEREAR
jgi:hypothetical protein